MRPRIGISCRLQDCGEFAQHMMGVKTPYVDSIAEAGGMPVLLPLLTNKELLREAYDSVDGLLIPGGEDVHPRFYGETPHEKLGTTSEIRDEVEIQLIRWAYEDDKPVLGVCRGLQIINVALGGSLIQDIPSQQPSELVHSPDEDRPNMWDAGSHSIAIAPTSQLASILKRPSIDVNSLHHQAVKKLSNKLTVTAKAPDGTVEAFEGSGKRFFIALQCHPEMLWQKATDPLWLNLFKNFIEIAGK